MNWKVRQPINITETAEETWITTISTIGSMFQIVTKGFGTFTTVVIMVDGPKELLDKFPMIKHSDSGSEALNDHENARQNIVDALVARLED